MEIQSFAFDSAMRRLDGDRELFRELVSYFLEDAPKLLDTMRVGLDSRDFKAVHRAAHNLRSLVANFDAKEAMASAQSMEAMATQGDSLQLKATLPRLEADVESLCQALHACPLPS